jgi:hypothetical protein
VPEAPLEEPPNPSDEEEDGTLEIDFDGFPGDPTAWVGWRTIRGGVEEWDQSVEDGGTVVTFVLDPGSYDAWWLDVGGRRLGTRVVVEAGRTTSVRAVDHRGAPPIPPGLGVLDVFVAASWGGGLATRVDLVGQDAEIYTNSLGHASATVLPGRYRVRIGDRESAVAVQAGQVTTHHIGHGNEGDLVILPADLRRPPRVAPVGDGLRPDQPQQIQLEGGDAWMFPYLAAGDYCVFLVNSDEDTLGIPLGRATVRPGQTTRFASEIPRGGVAVIVPTTGPRPERSLLVRRLVADQPSIESLVLHWLGDRTSVTLAPGRYVMTASIEGHQPASVEVEVADRVVQVTLEPSPLR